MTYIVRWWNNIDIDPLDRGVEEFTMYPEALEFARRLKNKGITCEILLAEALEKKYQP